MRAGMWQSINAATNDILEWEIFGFWWCGTHVNGMGPSPPLHGCICTDCGHLKAVWIALWHPHFIQVLLAIQKGATAMWVGECGSFYLALWSMFHFHSNFHSYYIMRHISCDHRNMKCRCKSRLATSPIKNFRTLTIEKWLRVQAVQLCQAPVVDYNLRRLF